MIGPVRRTLGPHDLPTPDLDAQLARLRRGTGDPSHRRHHGEWWRASSTPEGPVLLHLRPGDRVHAEAWGSGAEWALEQLPELLGQHDPVDGLVAHHPFVAEALRRRPELRVGRTGLVVEALVPAVVEQKVTGAEAFAAQRRLVRAYGTPAPGPAQVEGSPAYRMVCPPTAEQWRTVPSWHWLKAGVDASRSTTVVGACARAAALERTLTRPYAEADTGLRSLPGIGPWTSAEVRQRAHGDPDAWSIGDYHVPGLITLALVGEVLDDDAAEEILEPYRGHRYRVQRLVERFGPRPERRGPRRSVPTHLP